MEIVQKVQMLTRETQGTKYIFHEIWTACCCEISLSQAKSQFIMGQKVRTCISKPNPWIFLIFCVRIALDPIYCSPTQCFFFKSHHCWNSNSGNLATVRKISPLLKSFSWKYFFFRADARKNVSKFFFALAREHKTSNCFVHII